MNYRASKFQKRFNKFGTMISYVYIISIICGMTILILVSCRKQEDAARQSAEMMHQKILAEIMQNLGFFIATMPSEWRPIVVEGNAVLGWQKGKSVIHMYFYSFMDATQVLNNMSKGLHVKSDLHIEDYSTFVRSYSGIRNNAFVKLAVIPSQTGRDTFAFSYMEIISKRSSGKESVSWDLGDIDRLASQLTGLRTFDYLVHSFRFSSSDLMIQQGMQEEAILKND